MPSRLSTQIPGGEVERDPVFHVKAVLRIEVVVRLAVVRREHPSLVKQSVEANSGCIVGSPPGQVDVFRQRAEEGMSLAQVHPLQHVLPRIIFRLKGPSVDRIYRIIVAEV